MPALIYDIETRSDCDLKTAGLYNYSLHASTSVLCLGYAIDRGPARLWCPGQPVPDAFVAAATDRAWIAYAFNCAFEIAVTRHILEPRHGFPSIPDDRFRCLQTATLALALPPSLDLCAAALKLAHRTDKAGGATVRQLSQTRRPRVRQGEAADGVYWKFEATGARIEKLHAYCLQDVRVEQELLYWLLARRAAA
jgi:DNA polymerase